MPSQVLDQSSSSSSGNDEAVAMRPNPVKRKSGGGGRPSKKMLEEQEEPDEDGLMPAQLPIMDEEQSCGLHMTTMQVSASRACDHLGCEEINFLLLVQLWKCICKDVLLKLLTCSYLFLSHVSDVV